MPVVTPYKIKYTGDLVREAGVQKGTRQIEISSIPGGFVADAATINPGAKSEEVDESSWTHGLLVDEGGNVRASFKVLSFGIGYNEEKGESYARTDVCMFDKDPSKIEASHEIDWSLKKRNDSMEFRFSHPAKCGSGAFCDPSRLLAGSLSEQMNETLAATAASCAHPNTESSANNTVPGENDVEG